MLLYRLGPPVKPESVLLTVGLLAGHWLAQGAIFMSPTREAAESWKAWHGIDGWLCADRDIWEIEVEDTTEILKIESLWWGSNADPSKTLRAGELDMVKRHIDGLESKMFVAASYQYLVKPGDIVYARNLQANDED